MAVQYQLVTEMEVSDKVRKRYQSVIHELKSLGFEEMYFYTETMPILGVSSGFSGVVGTLIAMANEESKMNKNLSVSLLHLVMASRDYATYVIPFGLGIKFYTSFTDGTCIISANYQSNPIKDDTQKLYKFARATSVEEIWKHHKTWVDKLVSEGKQKKDIFSFNNYISLVKREDESMLKPKPTAVLSETAELVISVIVSMSLILFCVFTLIFFPAVIANIYPACWFVRNLREPSLLLNFLKMFAPLLVSWFFARIQRKAFTVDGVGTKFFGSSVSANLRGYISTKWLVVVFVPILPVRSYQIIEEQTQAVISPLDQLDWVQVKETIRQSKLGYGIILFVVIGMSLWSVWQCM